MNREMVAKKLTGVILIALFSLFTFAQALAQDKQIAAVADPKVQQAIDSLVQRGAVIKTTTDARGLRVTEVMLVGKQFTGEVIEQLRLFPDLETLRCINAKVDDEFVAIFV